MNNDMVTKIKADVTVASGDTVDMSGAEASAILLATINTTAVTLLEGDDSGGVGATAVDPKFILVGDEVGTVAANVVTYGAVASAQIGYVGKKRYVTITVANPAVDTTITLVKGELHNRPYGS
jgi:hypothetical protein